MWFHRKLNADPTVSFEALSRVCRFVVSADGVLDIRLLGPNLGYEDLRLVVERLETLASGTQLRAAAIDFQGIMEIQRPWTPVLALLVRLSRRTPLALSARHLHDQPASVAAIHRTSGELMRLIQPAEDPVDIDHEPRAA
ncbi:MAG: hypothetical protein L6Q92_05735 [Phycisphaerae bacterium]|nr:hypothetical protein [Phycisphaerae bacterium]